MGLPYGFRAALTAWALVGLTASLAPADRPSTRHGVKAAREPARKVIADSSKLKKDSLRAHPPGTTAAVASGANAAANPAANPNPAPPAAAAAPAAPAQATAAVQPPPQPAPNAGLSSAPASAPTVAPPAVPPVPVAPGGDAAVKSKVDSLLKSGSIVARDEDSLAQAEADSGAQVAPGGKPGLPFAMKKPTRKEIAAFQLAVLNAVTAMEKKDFAKARKVLAKAEPTERLAQVYKTILMANVFMGLQDYARADSVLQACLEWVGGSTWQSYLLNRRIQLFPLTNPDDSARLHFYAKVIEAPVGASVKVNFLYGLLKLQGFTGNPEGFETLLKRIVASAPSDRRLDSLYQLVSPFIPPGIGDWEQQDLMLDLETKLGLNAQGILRSEAALKLVPGKPEKQQMHWNYASLHFKSKDYQKAIPAFVKYMEKYGETADAILQIARCYDRLQEPKKAIIWYDRLLEKFPKADKTSEIYWLRAWDLEQQGNYVEATEFYYRQLADFSANKRGDWANFRVGICQYKAGNMGAAKQAFHAIRDQVNSNAYPAGMYWESKALDSLKDSAGARAALAELTLKYPLNFYGHLARQTLHARGAYADSLDPWRRFAPSTPEGIKAWMKDGMSGYRGRLDNEFESDYLSIGKLLQFRLDTLAILTLRTMPAKIKNNPWFLYVNARMLKNRQLWRESYKMGLQLSYKIPPDKWGSAPKEVLRLFFPRPYEGVVQKYAAKRKLDPAFVYALMRQESGFDRDIKSGAGAVGLMQMMPATGRAVAKKEKWAHFDPYSLTEAEVNVSLGTAYLRDLWKDYKGNSYWVLANYNAGPEPTKRWIAASANRALESGIEDISYWETRDYVKKVMGNYWTYRILWNNRAKSAASQTAAR
jgi:soluble lytic murein transglycosylase-like protein/tetratricopeptide (TPR) repeat protein